MDDIQVIDNFLPQEYFDSLTWMVEDLPWFFRGWSVFDWDNDPQLYHLFYFNGQVRSNEFFKYVYEVYEKHIPGTDGKGLYRMKMNGTARGQSLKEHQFHVDVANRDHKVCILYMNTNDGYTVFEESGEKVMSVANRALIFPGHLRHTGTNCTDAGLRILMNIDYFS